MQGQEGCDPFPFWAIQGPDTWQPLGKAAAPKQHACPEPWPGGGADHSVLVVQISHSSPGSNSNRDSDRNLRWEGWVHLVKSLGEKGCSSSSLKNDLI